MIDYTSIAIEQTSARLSAVLSRYGDAQPTFFDDGAPEKIVYRLLRLDMDVWEHGRPLFVQAAYVVRLYQKNSDPAKIARMAIEISNKDGIQCGGITAMEDDASGYQVWSMVANVWEGITYE